ALPEALARAAGHEQSGVPASQVDQRAGDVGDGALAGGHAPPSSGCHDGPWTIAEGPETHHERDLRTAWKRSLRRWRGPFATHSMSAFLVRGVGIVRRARLAVVAAGAAALVGLVAGCGGSSLDNASTPHNAPTVQNTALQTDSNGKTVSAPTATAAPGGGGG